MLDTRFPIWKLDAMEHPLTQYRKQHSLTLETLGRQIGVNRSAVWKWEVRGVPPHRVIEIERVTGIPRQALRPDLYPAEKRDH